MTARDRPSTPGYVYVAITIVLVVLIGAFALTARQTPPPTIAEFAPQAVEQITQAPENQSGHAGGGDGGGSGVGEDGGALNPATAQSPINVPRVRRCVGDPPRQIEDPQSPPCVPYWEGDNGGATSKGVTRDTITIAIPDHKYALPELEAFFNRRFEFYGRHIKLVPFEPGVQYSGSRSGDPTVNMQSDAGYVDQELRAFASSTYTDPGADRDGEDDIYYDELTRRGIVSANARATMLTDAKLARNAPFEWSWLPGEDVMGRMKAEWICSSLKGRPARFAGGLQLGRPRVFGLVYAIPTDGNRPPLDQMRQALGACGITIAAEAEAQSATDYSNNAVVKMQSSNVTSVICECNSVANQVQSSSSHNGYFPEWLVGSYLLQDEEFHGRAGIPGQQEHAFGVSFWNPYHTVADSAFAWAVKEEDPSFSFTFLEYNNMPFEYAGLLLLASGIQMAGPRLTPETFRSGLQRTVFPNPNAGDAPYYQARVGFLPGRYWEVQDASVIWWGANQRSRHSDGGTGTWCYAHGGTRFGSDRRWPADDSSLFSGDCS